MLLIYRSNKYLSKHLPLLMCGKTSALCPFRIFLARCLELTRINFMLRCNISPSLEAGFNKIIACSTYCATTLLDDSRPEERSFVLSITAVYTAHYSTIIMTIASNVCRKTRDIQTIVRSRSVRRTNRYAYVLVFCMYVCSMYLATAPQ